MKTLRAIFLTLSFLLGSAASAQVDVAPLGANSGIGGQSAPPSGAAGGSLGGTYPNPTVVTNANLTGDTTSVGNATTTTGINGVALTTAWTAYTPTATCTAGTITTSTITGRSKTVGKIIFLQIHLVVTVLGTCTGNISLTLPVTAAAFIYPVTAYNEGTGLLIGAFANGTTVFLSNAAALGTVTADVNGSYESN